MASGGWRWAPRKKVDPFNSAVSMNKIKRALISVTDKTGVADFARGLAKRGVEIVATGGTARALADEGVRVRSIEDVTGFPECLSGRVKTLHPKIHGGILNARANDEHRGQIARLDIQPIDLVAVNLYAFEEATAKAGATLDEAIEHIDIGGPALLRSAAKNWGDVTVVSDPADYARVLAALGENDGATPPQLRFELAGKAFALTARYDAAIANFLEARPEAPAELPRHLRLTFVQRQELRYGENPHQRPAHLYAACPQAVSSVVAAEQLHGKQLSYNNFIDLDVALQLVREFEQPAAVCIKHANPCGAATADTPGDALSKSLAGDPEAAYGCIIGLNRTVDARSAERLASQADFVEAIIAPEFAPEALDVLRTKPSWKKNVRILQAGRLENSRSEWSLRQVSGGLLVQPSDDSSEEFDDWQIRTDRAPTPAEDTDLRFAWLLCKHVKSNAIVLVKDQALVGLGAGQVSRVDSARLAVLKAGARAAGAVLGSDAFFPFRDGVDAAAAAGVTAIIQPGGSKRDDETIAAADEHNIAMVFTGRRHFRH